MNIQSNTSKYMLKYQKAKAKLVEYGVDKVNYPNFALNSNDLSYTTTYIISKYVESIIENDDNTRKGFYPHLELVAQYFDAAVNSKDREMHSIDFLLSGAAAYFLSDDFGSSRVLCSKITQNFNNMNPQTMLLEIFRFLHFNQEIRIPTKQSLSRMILKGLKDYFSNNILRSNFDEVLSDYRHGIYKRDNPMEIYYVDILIAIITEMLKKTSWKLLPEYSGLDCNTWAPYIKKKNSIKIMWPAQQIIGESGVLRGLNSIVQLPTGVGKTRSIELIIRSAFLAKRASTAIIIAPLRALCNEISYDLGQAFESEVVINQFTDVLQEDFSLENGMIFKERIFICTPEKLNYIIHHEIGILSEIDLFIFDEAHMFDDGKRGAIYELLLTEIRGQISDKNQVVLLSAVLSNAVEISGWMFEQNGVVTSSDGLKSTPKSIGFVSKNTDVYYYTDDVNEYDFFIPRSIKKVELDMFKRERKKRYFPEINEAKDIALFQANKLCRNGGVAIYVNKTESINTVLKRAIDIVSRGYNLSNIKENSDVLELEKISYLMSIHYGIEHEFTEASKFGIVPHYSDLANGLKLAVEYSLRHNNIRFVVCTSTLAQGVNIPIKYLFITSFQTSRDRMQIRNFQNLMGRTARTGMYTEGSLIITDAKLYDEKTDRRNGGRYRWNDCISMFDPINAEVCNSSILMVTQSFNVDYETKVNGSKIVQFIVDNYSNSDWDILLINDISEWYEKKFPDRTKDKIIAGINLRKSIVEIIENHLCFVFSNNRDENFGELSKKICLSTLAYALSTAEEKELLLQIFEVITQKIVQFDMETIHDYARTMIGIDFSEKILDWIISNSIGQVIYSDDQLLKVIIEFFYSSNNLKISNNVFEIICDFWISGQTYFEIFCDTKINLKIKDIEKICNKILSYELSFFIGNIIDLLHVESEVECSVFSFEQLQLLQKKIKYGVSTKTEISICEEVFNDRYIAKIVAEQLNDINIQNADIINALKREKVEILILLEKYPRYFTDKFTDLSNV